MLTDMGILTRNIKTGAYRFQENKKESRARKEMVIKDCFNLIL